MKRNIPIPEDPPTASRSIFAGITEKQVASAILLVGVYFSLVALSVQLSFGGFLAPIWLPAGFIVVLLIMRGLRCIPVIVVVGIFESFFFGQISVESVLFSIFRNSALGLTAYVTFRHFTQHRTASSETQQVSAFFASAGLAAAVYVAFHSFWLHLRPDSWVDSAMPIWFAWSGCFTGIMVFLPLVFAFRREGTIGWDFAQRSEWALLNALIVGAVIFAPWVAERGDILSHAAFILPFAALVLAALRFGLVAAVVGNILLFLTFSIQAVLGYAMFAAHDLFDRYLFIIAYVGISLVLSSFWGWRLDRFTSERSRARDSLHLVRSILDGLPVGLLVRSMSGGNMIVNQPWAAMVGQPTAALEGDQSSDAWAAFPTEWRELISCLEGGKESIASAQVRGSATLPGSRAEAMTLVVKRLGKASEAAPSDDRVLALLIDHELWASSKTAIALSEDRLKTAMESASLGFWDADQRTNFTYRDDNWYRILGIPESQFGQEASVWFDRIATEDRLRVVKTFENELRKNGDFSEVEYRIRCGDGRYTWVQDRARVVEVNEAGEPTRVMGVMQDITARKKTELRLREAMSAAEVANRTKDDFIASISHEIRTPLNAIIGLSSFLMEAEIGEEEQEFAETIYSSGNSLLEMLEELLDFSRIEAGKVVFDTQEFPLRGMFEDIYRLFRSRARDKGLSLELDLDSALPEYALGDMGRIRQVVTNLIGNALKFTERGEVVLSARWSSTEELPPSARAQIDETCPFLADTGFDLLRVEVRDTGIGIPKASQDSIFDAFSQVDATTTRKYGGTGLGLSISRQIVQGMGGAIWVDSQLRKGSVFQFIVRVGATKPIQFTSQKQGGGHLSKAIVRTPGLANADSGRDNESGDAHVFSQARKRQIVCLGLDGELDVALLSALKGHDFKVVMVDLSAEALEHALVRGADALLINCQDASIANELMGRVAKCRQPSKPRLYFAWKRGEASAITPEEARLMGFDALLSPDSLNDLLIEYFQKT